MFRFDFDGAFAVAARTGFCLYELATIFVNDARDRLSDYDFRAFTSRTKNLFAQTLPRRIPPETRGIQTAVESWYSETFRLVRICAGVKCSSGMNV